METKYYATVEEWKVAGEPKGDETHQVIIGTPPLGQKAVAPPSPAEPLSPPPPSVQTLGQREQEFKDALALAERIQRGEVDYLRDISEKGDPAEEVAFWESIEDVRSQLAQIEEYKRVAAHPAEYELPSGQEKEYLEHYRKMVEGSTSPFVKEGEVDVVLAVKAGQEEQLAGLVTPERIREAKEYIARESFLKEITSELKKYPDLPTAVREGKIDVLREAKNIGLITDEQLIVAQSQAADIGAKEWAERQLLGYINPITNKPRWQSVIEDKIDPSVLRIAGYDISNERYNEIRELITKASTEGKTLESYRGYTTREIETPLGKFLVKETTYDYPRALKEGVSEELLRLEGVSDEEIGKAKRQADLESRIEPYYDKRTGKLNVGLAVEKGAITDMEATLFRKGDVDVGLPASVVTTRDVFKEILSFGQAPTYTFNRDNLADEFGKIRKEQLESFDESVHKARAEFEAELPSSYDDAQRQAEVSDMRLAVSKDEYISQNLSKFDEEAAKVRSELQGKITLIEPETGVEIFSGTKDEYVKWVVAVAPSLSVLVKEAGIGLVPVYGTIYFWDKMNPAWKTVSIAFDVLTFVPIVRGAVAGARMAAGTATRGAAIASSLSRQARVMGALRGLGLGVEAEVKAPFVALAHPIRTAKIMGKGIRDIGEYLFHPRQLPTSSVTRVYSWGGIPVEEAGSPQEAMRIRDVLETKAAGGDFTPYEYNGRQWKYNPSALGEMGGLVHSTPDVKELAEGLAVEARAGMPAKETGLFVSHEPMIRFAQESAFGGKTIPTPYEVSMAVTEVGKYRPVDLVRIDVSQVRPVNLADVPNIPEDLASRWLDYIKKRGLTVYGSFSEWLKVEKALRPNDLDIVAPNSIRNEVLDDMIGIAQEMGYDAKRVEKGIAIRIGGVEELPMQPLAEPKIDVTGVKEINGRLSGDVYNKKGLIVRTEGTYRHPTIGGEVRRRVSVVVVNEKGELLLVTDKKEPKGYLNLPGGGFVEKGGASDVKGGAWSQIRDEVGIDIENMEQLPSYLGQVNRHSLPGSYVVTGKAYGNQPIDLNWFSREFPDDPTVKKGLTEITEAKFWDGKSPIEVSPAAYDVITKLVEEGKLKGINPDMMKISPKTPAELITARDTNYYRPANLSVGGVNVEELARVQQRRLQLASGEWVPIVQVDTMSHHGSLIPKELQQPPVIVDGLKTERLGEQYLKQGYAYRAASEMGEVGADAVAKRVTHLKAAAGDVLKKLKEIGAEQREPGFIIYNAKTGEEAIPTDKLFAEIAEYEKKFAVGEQLPEMKGRYFTRPAEGAYPFEKVSVLTEEPLSLWEVGKLKMRGPIEAVRTIFTPPITVDGVPMARGVDLLEEASRYEYAAGRARVAGDVALAERLMGEARYLRASSVLLERVAGELGTRAGTYGVAGGLGRIAATRRMAEPAVGVATPLRVSPEREYEEVVFAGREPIAEVPRERLAEIPREAIVEVPREVVTEASREAIAREPVGEPPREAVTRIDIAEIPRTGIFDIPREPVSRIPPPEVPRELVPRIPPPEIPRIGIPEIPKVPPKKVATKDYAEQVIKIREGTVTWVQGRPQGSGGEENVPMWKVLPPPYRQEDFFTMRETPPGAVDEGWSGRGMTKKSLQIIGGIPDKDIEDIDLGWTRINIRVKGTKPEIEYVHDEEANVGERSQTVGMGRGQIPIEAWEEAKARGVSYDEFARTYRGELVGGKANEAVVKAEATPIVVEENPQEEATVADVSGVTESLREELSAKEESHSGLRLEELEIPEARVKEIQAVPINLQEVELSPIVVEEPKLELSSQGETEKIGGKEAQSVPDIGEPSQQDIDFTNRYILPVVEDEFSELADKYPFVVRVMPKDKAQAYYSNPIPEDSVARSAILDLKSGEKVALITVFPEMFSRLMESDYKGVIRHELAHIATGEAEEKSQEFKDYITEKNIPSEGVEGEGLRYEKPAGRSFTVIEGKPNYSELYDRLMKVAESRGLKVKIVPYETLTDYAAMNPKAAKLMSYDMPDNEIHLNERWNATDMERYTNLSHELNEMGMMEDGKGYWESHREAILEEGDKTPERWTIPKPRSGSITVREGETGIEVEGEKNLVPAVDVSHLAPTVDTSNFAPTVSESGVSKHIDRMLGLEMLDEKIPLEMEQGGDSELPVSVVRSYIRRKKPKNFRDWWESPYYEKPTKRVVETAGVADRIYLGHKLLPPDLGVIL